MANDDSGTLKDSEVHPSAHTAYVWFNEMVLNDPLKYALIKESVSSTALSGNRLAQICSGTMDRLEKGEPVSDRYLLGLCWFLRDFIEKDTNQDTEKETPNVAPVGGDSSL